MYTLCVYVRSDLGCGKTCFARGFIRATTQDAALQVTSPTYLLVNTYDLPGAAASPSRYTHFSFELRACQRESGEYLHCDGHNDTVRSTTSTSIASTA